MYVKPSTLIEDSWWSFKPRIILDYKTYSQLKGYPAQKLWPSLKHVEVSHNTTKFDMTNNEKKSIESNYEQKKELSVIVSIENCLVMLLQINHSVLNYISNDYRMKLRITIPV